MRLLLADVIALTGELRSTLLELGEPSDRAYVELEIDRLQAAAHRIVAFLDGVEGETRN